MSDKWVRISGQWNKCVVDAKKKWSELSDADLSKVNGNRDTLVSAVQKCYKINKKDAGKQVDVWVASLRV